MDRNAAYEEGLDAYNVGLTYCSNPYSMESAEFADWNAGWSMGFDQFMNTQIEGY